VRRWCTVTVTDLDGRPHSVDVLADSTYDAPVDFIGTPDSVAVQIYSMLGIVHGAIHGHTGLSGFQKGVLMFHVVAVDGAFQSEDGPKNAMIDETQRQMACDRSRGNRIAAPVQILR
jgi:hypothetical protein